MKVLTLIATVPIAAAGGAGYEKAPADYDRSACWSGAAPAQRKFH
jgi:hypothetical protein